MSYLRANRERVQTNMAGGAAPPSPEQLGHFMQQMCADINGILGVAPGKRPGAPASVIRIVRKNMNAIRWDMGRNRASCSTPPLTPEALETFLVSSIADLENWSPPVAVGDGETGNLTAAAARLWDLDVHRCTPRGGGSHGDYSLSLQRYTRPGDTSDHTREPLFTEVEEGALQRSTYARFVALLDNYKRQVGLSEAVTPQQRAEEVAFLEAVMDTAVGQYAHAWLAASRKAPPTREAFIHTLQELWFTRYRREAANDSSAFEHTFVGESKEGHIVGLHNWVQLYLEERKGALNYHGYIRPRGASGYRTSHENEQLLSLQFSWDGEVKPVSTSFIGTSPEFEIMLYSMCFLAGHEKNTVQVGPYRVEVVVYPFRAHGATYIGTAYPSEAPMNENEAATRIQAVHRGRNTRAKGAEAASREAHERRARQQSATRIQSNYRGSRQRRS